MLIFDTICWSLSDQIHSKYAYLLENNNKEDKTDIPNLHLQYSAAALHFIDEKIYAIIKI